LYALRINTFMPPSEKRIMSLFKYSSIINFISLVFPFRSGDYLYYMNNNRAPISIKENYRYFIYIKIAELMWLMIFCCIYYVKSNFYFILPIVILLCFMKKNYWFQFYTIGYLIILIIFIKLCFPMIGWTSIELFILLTNFIIPFASFAIFGAGDIILHYNNLIPLSELVNMRFSIFFGVILIFSIYRLNDVVIHPTK